MCIFSYEGAVGTFRLLLVVLRWSLSKPERYADTVALFPCDNGDGSCQETPILFFAIIKEAALGEVFSFLLLLLLR